MKPIGSIICFFRGHRRGKRVGLATDIVTGKINFYCPRCGKRWTRKARKAKAGQ